MAWKQISIRLSEEQYKSLRGLMAERKKINQGYSLSDLLRSMIAVGIEHKNEIR
jgi:hypothetical protein